MESKPFSLIKAIRAAADRKEHTGAQLDVVKAGKEELRKSGLAQLGNLQISTEYRSALSATVAGSGAEVIGTDKQSFLSPLKSTLVAAKAGATFLTGLTGNCSIPTYSGTTVLWKGDGISAVEGAGSTGTVELKPMRLTSFIEVTNKFLHQDSISAEEFLQQEMIEAISNKLEATIFGKEAGSDTQPAGFFATAPALKGTASRTQILDLEQAIDRANALNSGAYITNATGRRILKSTVKANNTSDFLIEPDGTMNGYPVLVTNNVASGLQVEADQEGIVFGNWQHFVIASWGVLDLIVDPYTKHAEGKVVITINSYHDAKPRYDNAFVTASFKA